MKSKFERMSWLARNWSIEDLVTEAKRLGIDDAEEWSEEDTYGLTEAVVEAQQKEVLALCMRDIL